jgi:hypothetical protein
LTWTPTVTKKKEEASPATTPSKLAIIYSSPATNNKTKLMTQRQPLFSSSFPAFNPKIKKNRRTQQLFTLSISAFN